MEEVFVKAGIELLAEGYSIQDVKQLVDESVLQYNLGSTATAPKIATREIDVKITYTFPPCPHCGVKESTLATGSHFCHGRIY